MAKANQYLFVGRFPFYWRTKESAESDKEFGTMMLDFVMTYDPDFGFLKQEMSDELNSAIESVYHFDHNIGYLQEGAEEFKTYGLEYLDVISNKLDVSKSINDPLKVVDIGCGGGLVLNEIKKRYPNSKLHGVDPSPLAERASQKFNFNLSKDFYPPKQRDLISGADLILNYDVLEHVANPLIMLENIYADLRNDGILIFSVPDCSTAIKNGDISMCIHEHLNYFSTTSLKLLVEGAGFQNVDVFAGKHGGTLFCVAEKKAVTAHLGNVRKAHDQAELFSNFVSKNRRVCEKIEQFLYQIGDATIGFYVPLRTIPYLSKLNINKGFRFYDDSCFFKNRFLDGFEDEKILGIRDLELSPPQYTVVMTHAYGTKIKQKIEERSIDTRVVLINEFYQQA